MNHINIGRKNKPGIKLTLVILCAIAALAIAISVFIFKAVEKAEENKLNELRTEMLTELRDNEGEYDEARIVLADTTKTKAMALASKLNAELRLNSYGNFATLTLPDGVTILDVCEDDTYLEYLPEFSIDYMAYITDVEDEEISTRAIPPHRDIMSQIARSRFRLI